MRFVLLSKLKVDDDKYKQELIMEMKCIIHYYAESEDDIIRLEEVIGLADVKTAMEYHEESLINEGMRKSMIIGSFNINGLLKKN